MNDENNEDWVEYVKRGLAFLVPTGIGIWLLFYGDCIDTAVVGSAGWILAGALFFALLVPRDWFY